MTIKTFEEYKLFSNITNISITGLIQYLDEDYGFNTIMNFSGYYDKIIHTKEDYIMALTEYPGPNNYNCMQDEIRFDDDDESYNLCDCKTISILLSLHFVRYFKSLKER
tara:strand:+ start:2379 stop:2705 length:327 start_codon:yes stop_codon:yes gene_type:complete